MTDDGQHGHGAAYRGFLFTDVRGFSAFAERHGNAATAVMIRRFLDLARGAIARHDGAEIKTEGDNVFAVFKSASSAVMCGLEIVEAAAEQRSGDLPLRVGVGIHAGEAVETAEGYVGRAVIIAARLCAVASAGEVLVSSTVKGIAQASIPVGFIARGRRRLKGIQDPIVVYAVSRDPNARARRGLPRPRVLAAAASAALVALVGFGVLAATLRPANPLTSPSAAAALPTGRPVVMGPLTIGTYVATEFQPRFEFAVADTGWAANRHVAGLFGLLREGQPAGASLYVARVQEVIANPCVDGGEGATGPQAVDVLEQMEEIGHLALTNVGATEVGGYRGRQADVVVDEGALAACGGPVGGEVSVFISGDEVWAAAPGERFRLLSIDVEGEWVTILLSLDWTQMHSVQELETLLTLGQRILDSMAFSTSAGG